MWMLSTSDIPRPLNEKAESSKADNDHAPGDLMVQARGLIAALESPMETMFWMLWTEASLEQDRRKLLIVKINHRNLIQECSW